MRVTACKGCVKPKRHPGCHDHCPEYIAQKTKNDEIRKKMQGDISHVFDGMSVERKIKREKKHGR